MQEKLCMSWNSGDNWNWQRISASEQCISKVSPKYPQSNGKAESAVKIAKRLIQKPISSEEDLWLCILNWRNTPNNNGSSPVQRLMSRRTRCALPTTHFMLKPFVQKDVVEKITHKRQVSKKQFDKKAKRLPELEIGN